MCLPIKVHHPEVVLAEGEHLGYEWAVVHNDMGFRCGYIRLPKWHPWYGKGYDDIPVSVHGGLTFAEPDTPCDKGGPDDGYWIGFDCCHIMDAPDPSLPSPRGYHLPKPPGGIIRTQEYVEAECRSLCQQALDADTTL